jgi:hypothetical protein
MAKTNGDAYQPLLPQLGQDSKRALKGPTPKHLINKAKKMKKIKENKTVRIKIESKKSPFHHIPLTKIQKAFFRKEDLCDLIHTDQTGTIPFTS